LKSLLKISQYDDADLEFYGWECISLKLPTRTIDFVIKDDHDRKMFVVAIEAAMNPLINIKNNPIGFNKIKSYSKFLFLILYLGS
jgi:hypothetical protein